MAEIQHKEISANTIPLFDSEYRIEDSQFNIVSDGSGGENNARNKEHQSRQSNNLCSKLMRFFSRLFFRHVEDDFLMEIRENAHFQVQDQPFQAQINNLLAVPNNSASPHLILRERIPRNINTYIGLDVNDSDLIFVFREENRIIIPYLHKSPKEDDVILCRNLDIIENNNNNIREIISNLPKLYKANGLEDNPRECNWERDGRNNEQVMICKRTEDGHKVYWKVNQGSLDLVVTYKRVLAVKGSI